MGTTTNNGWTYPESTDLVKDGATAIETLATDIDTTLGVYAPSTSGLELVSSLSFSGVTSQSLNDVFSATYTNYKIILNDITPPGAGAQITFRMRVAGADNSTAGNYMWAELGLETDGGASSNNGGAAATSFNIDFNDGGNGISAAFDIYTPFVTTDVTRYTGISQSYRSDYTNSWFRSKGGNMSVTTSYTGFTIICSSGNMSGSVSVYGYSV